jgi:hypothetical protein
MLSLPPGFHESMRELDSDEFTEFTTASITFSENADGQVLTSQEYDMNLPQVAMLASAFALATIGTTNEIES